MYKLKFPESIKILCIQHISVLKPANSDALLIINTLNIDSKSQKKI